MKINILTFLFILAAITLKSQQLPIVDTKDAVVFGDNRLQITVSKKDGSTAAITMDQKLIAANDKNDTRPWLDICSPKGNKPEPKPYTVQERSWLGDDNNPWKYVSHQRMADDTLHHVVIFDNWSVDVYTQILPEKRQLRRWYDLAWNGPQTNKVYAFLQRFPKMNMAPDSFVKAPTITVNPQVFDQKSLEKNGTILTNQAQLAIFQLNPKLSVSFITNELAEGYDFGRGLIEIHDRKANSANRTVTIARMKPGVKQRIGDFWLWCQFNDYDTALLRTHEWFKDRGLVPPANRPDWVQRCTLYSMHPRGRDGSLTGFVETMKHIPRYKNLGCNIVWFLPLEDAGTYWPRDYYKFQEGLGTPQDYKNLVALAHNLGMRIWQDIVPHGGCNIYPRAIEHPEWLLRQEDGSTLYYWCYDFYWPTWIDYMKNVASHYVKNYNIDGFRIDAVSGSKTENWNLDIPYPRASNAIVKGGIAMQKAIREAVRDANPNGATLAEVAGNVFNAFSDCIYDFALGHSLHEARSSSPKDFVANMSNWIHERQYATAPGSILLRYVETHDTLRGEYAYGPEGLKALQALVSWIYGIPMLYYNMEDGHAPVIRKIFETRNALVEIGEGSQDMLSASAPDGVFAILRQATLKDNPAQQYRWDNTPGPRAALCLINMNPHTVQGTVSIPKDKLHKELLNDADFLDIWNEKLIPVTQTKDALTAQITLEPFRMTVLRLGSNSKPAFTKNSLFTGNASKQLDVQAWNISKTGQKTPIALNKQQLVLTGDFAGQLIRIPVDKGEACQWRVTAANGVWEDDFRTRHPNYAGGILGNYYLPQDGNVLWDSRFWPFGLTPDKARIDFATPKGTVTLQFDPQKLPKAVFILDRIGDDHTPHVFIASNDIITEICPEPLPKTSEPTVEITNATVKPNLLWDGNIGDQRLTFNAGHWKFDNGKIQVWIARSGDLVKYLKYQPDGSLKTVLERPRLYTDGGFGQGRQHYNSFEESEPFSRLERLPNSDIRLAFTGRLRMRYRFGIIRPPLYYHYEYCLGNEDGFRFTQGQLNTAAPTAEHVFVGFRGSNKDFAETQFRSKNKTIVTAKADTIRSGETTDPKTIGEIDEIRILNEDGDLCLRFSDIIWTGPTPRNIFMHHNTFFFAWHDGESSTLGVNTWRMATAWLSTNLDKAPKLITLDTIRSLKHLSPKGTQPLLMDMGFEQYQQIWLNDIVQSIPRSNGWSLPPTAVFDTNVKREGKASIRIEGVPGQFYQARQHIAFTKLEPGTTWKLSCWAKGKNITNGPQNWMKPLIRFRTEGKKGKYHTTYMPFGDFDWKYFSTTVTIPEGTETVQVGLGLDGCPGTIWIDDVKLEQVK